MTESKRIPREIMNTDNRFLINGREDFNNIF